jgi:uncharacterized repeat protein (TIGR03806 family)
MIRYRLPALLLFAAATLAACRDDAQTDAGTADTSTPDAETDGGSDVAEDPSGDPAPDTTPDATDDARPDADRRSDADADADSGVIPNPPGYCDAPAPPRVSDVVVAPVFAHAFPTEEDASRITHLVASPFAAGEWYAVKHKGWVIRFSEDPDVAGHEVVLDLRDGRVSVANDEAGIVSLAFHPSGQWAVLAYQAPTLSGAYFDSVISRFDVRDDGTIDPDSELELVRLPQPYFPHSVDHVAFDADGLLYAAFGDGGTVAARVQAQDPFSFYGTLIRIDIRAPDAVRGTSYSVPPENPFADGVRGAPEVFAYGLRNTWRFSIDRAEGTVWGGDVGESTLEEVNRIVPGGNYGWPIMEGDRCFEAATCDQAGLEPPIVAYPRSEGISVTGGFVYRGSAIPSLVGRYVYADYLSGLIWSIDAGSEAGGADVRLEAETGFWISSFGEGPDGELYVIRWSQAEHLDKTGPGGIYRLEAAVETGLPDPFPTLLSQTGCMSPEDVTRPASGLLPFEPASTLWSDGAEKERYLSLPDNGTVTVDADGNLLFPPGTVLVKTFRYGDRLHETRLYIHHAEVGWRGYTYRWRADQSDADLLATGLDETLPNAIEWRYPSRGECARCHTAAAAYALGLEVPQLTWAPDGGERTQLDRWVDMGLFAPDVDLDALDAFLPLRAVDDETATTEQRARSYLHSNCSGCHREGGPPQSPIDLRHGLTLAEMNVCDARPFNGTLGLDDTGDLRVVVPGAPDASILYLRLTHPGRYRMPPLGTALIDEDGSSAVRAWIESLESCPE